MFPALVVALYYRLHVPFALLHGSSCVRYFQHSRRFRSKSNSISVDIGFCISREISEGTYTIIGVLDMTKTMWEPLLHQEQWLVNYSRRLAARAYFYFLVTNFLQTLMQLVIAIPNKVERLMHTRQIHWPSSCLPYLIRGFCLKVEMWYGPEISSPNLDHRLEYTQSQVCRRPRCLEIWSRNLYLMQVRGEWLLKINV